MRWVTARPFILSEADKNILGLSAEEPENLKVERRFLITEGLYEVPHPDSLPPNLFFRFARMNTDVEEGALLAFASNKVVGIGSPLVCKNPGTLITREGFLQAGSPPKSSISTL